MNAFFPDIGDILFNSSEQDNLNIALAEMYGVLVRGPEKQSLYSSQCKDAERHG